MNQETKPVYYTIPKRVENASVITTVYGERLRRITCNRCRDIVYALTQSFNPDWNQICHCNTEYFYSVPHDLFYGIGTIPTDGWESIWKAESKFAILRLNELGILLGDLS